MFVAVDWFLPLTLQKNEFKNARQKPTLVTRIFMICCVNRLFFRLVHVCCRPLKFSWEPVEGLSAANRIKVLQQ